MNPVSAPTFFLVLLLTTTGYSLRVIKEYERAVVYTLGKFSGVKGPGIVFLTPVVQAMVRVDMRLLNLKAIETLSVTGDQPLTLEAEVYFRVLDAGKAVNSVADYKRAVAEFAKTAMREKLQRRSSRDILDNLAGAAAEISKTLDAQTQNWGVTIQSIILREPAVSTAAVNQPV